MRVVSRLSHVPMIGQLGSKYPHFSKPPFDDGYIWLVLQIAATRVFFLQGDDH